MERGKLPRRQSDQPVPSHPFSFLLLLKGMLLLIERERDFDVRESCLLHAPQMGIEPGTYMCPDQESSPPPFLMYGMAFRLPWPTLFLQVWSYKALLHSILTFFFLCTTITFSYSPLKEVTEQSMQGGSKFPSAGLSRERLFPLALKLFILTGQERKIKIIFCMFMLEIGKWMEVLQNPEVFTGSSSLFLCPSLPVHVSRGCD